MAGVRARPARRGMYTVGFAGYDGGEFATSPDVDVCFVVRSQSVHRIQEAQAAAWAMQLWTAVQRDSTRTRADAA